MAELTEREWTEEEVMAKLAVLQPISYRQQCEIVCSLIGHSRIQTLCWGYYNCARSGAQVGDSLASTYPGAEKAVVVGHNCEVCRKNYEECTWKDKLFAPDPFATPDDKEGEAS